MLFENHVTVKQAAEMLGVSERTIFRYFVEKDLPSVKVAGKRWIKKDDLKKLLEP